MLTVGEDKNVQFCLSYISLRKMSIINMKEHILHIRDTVWRADRYKTRITRTITITKHILHDIKIISRKYTFVKNAFPVVHVTYRLKSRTLLYGILSDINYSVKKWSLICGKNIVLGHLLPYSFTWCLDRYKVYRYNVWAIAAGQLPIRWRHLWVLYS